jgi:pimeloyl-ACP methyl ester carboxylesterase
MTRPELRSSRGTSLADEDSVLYEQDRTARSAPWDSKAFSRMFRHETARVSDGLRIHYVIGGNGSALVLLHGFPQHWREWRLVMPAMADAGYTVIAPDMRGFGESDKPLDGFDVRTVSEDIRELIRQLGQERVDLAGHDVGASVAYAWAAAHPDEVRRLVLLEALPAGLEPPSAGVPVLQGKATWHLAFGSTPDVPEALLANRERTLVEYLFRHAYDPTTFSDLEIDAYVRPLASLGGIRGALAHIRAMPQSAAHNRRISARKLAMPVLAIGSAMSFGRSMAEGARQFAENVTAVVAERSGHWIPEERPVWLSRQLISFLGESRAKPELAQGQGA